MTRYHHIFEQPHGEWVANTTSRMFADMSDACDGGLRLAEIGKQSAAALVQHTLDAMRLPMNAGRSTPAGLEPRTATAYDPRQSAAAE